MSVERKLKTKKVMENEVKEKMVQMIIEYAGKYGLTVSNIREVMDEVTENMNDNATLQAPDVLIRGM